MPFNLDVLIAVLNTAVGFASFAVTTLMRRKKVRQPVMRLIDLLVAYTYAGLLIASSYMLNLNRLFLWTLIACAASKFVVLDLSTPAKTPDEWCFLHSLWHFFLGSIGVWAMYSFIISPHMTWLDRMIASEPVTPNGKPWLERILRHHLHFLPRSKLSRGKTTNHTTNTITTHKYSYEIK